MNYHRLPSGQELPFPLPALQNPHTPHRGSTQPSTQPRQHQHQPFSSTGSTQRAQTQPAAPASLQGARSAAAVPLSPPFSRQHGTPHEPVAPPLCQLATMHPTHEAARRAPSPGSTARALATLPRERFCTRWPPLWRPPAPLGSAGSLSYLGVPRKPPPLRFMCARIRSSTELVSGCARPCRALGVWQLARRRAGTSYRPCNRVLELMLFSSHAATRHLTQLLNAPVIVRPLPVLLPWQRLPAACRQAGSQTAAAGSPDPEC